MSTLTLHPVAAAFQALRNELNRIFLERRDAIEAIMLAVLAGEHVFLLGPPGTSKSKIVRTMIEQINSARHFEIGMSKQRPAEAVLGPLDIKEFRENGNYFLKREGYASAVEFFFCDEIGKMSSILGHDLLMLANERAYTEVNGGRSVHKAPLSTMFSASNEELTGDNDDAAALWDRQLVRVVVDYIKNDDAFMALMTQDLDVKPETTIEWADLKDVIDNVIPAIPLDDTAIKGLVSLRSEFRRHHLVPSDRRWRQSRKIMQAHAFLAGRDAVTEDDLVALRYTLWDTVEQIEKVHRLCMEAANPFVKPLMEISDALREVDAAITEREGTDVNGNDQTTARVHYGREGTKKLQTARDQLDSLLMEAAGRPIPGFKQVSDEHERVIRRLFRVCLEQNEQEIEAMLKRRLGQGDGGNQ